MPLTSLVPYLNQGAVGALAVLLAIGAFYLSYHHPDRIVMIALGALVLFE